MAFNHGNAEPGRERFQGEVRQIGFEHLRQVAHVEKSRGFPGKAGALMLAPQNGEIKAQGITQNHMCAGKVAVPPVDLRKAVRRFYCVIGNAMNCDRFRRDRLMGIDQRGEVTARERACL